MLNLTRRPNEAVILELPTGEQVRILVCDIDRNKVKLGIAAPRAIPVHRQEVYDAIKQGRPRKIAG